MLKVLNCAQFEPEPDSDEDSDLDTELEEQEEEDEYEEGSSTGKRRSLGGDSTPKKRRRVDVSKQQLYST